MKFHRPPSTALLDVLAGNLRRLRIARGLTPAQLARACRRVKSAISNKPPSVSRSPWV
jgi:transcriptional regulator with XRE-family HTH domain